MYWPLNIARRLLPPTIVEEEDTQAGPSKTQQPAAIQISPSSPSSQPSHFILLTPSTIHLYSVRPAQAVASLRRTAKSVDDYGSNKRCWWRPTPHPVSHGAEIVVETTSSYLMIYAIQPSEPSQAYSYSATGTASSSKPKGGLAPSAKSLKAAFAAAAGEAYGSWAAESGELRIGDKAEGSSAPSQMGRGDALEIRLRLALRVDAGLSCSFPTTSHLLISTINPPAIQAIPWPDPEQSSSSIGAAPNRKARTVMLSELSWFHASSIQEQSDAETTPTMADQSSSFTKEEAEQNINQTYVTSMTYSRAMDVFTWISSDGRAYIATLDIDEDNSPWRGRCFHGTPKTRRSSNHSSHGPDEDDADVSSSRETSRNPRRSTDREAMRAAIKALPLDQQAQSAAINAKIGLVAIGQDDGTIAVYNFRSQYKAVLSHRLSLRTALRSTASYLATGPVQCMQWTSDGLALAVGWERGWSIWSAWGRLMGHSYADDSLSARNRHFSDSFVDGVTDLFWAPGGTELFMLAGRQRQPEAFPIDKQLFGLPFAKSAVAGQHSPDNTRFAFIQLDDGVLVYRGSDQPDMSVINPESDVWQHIRIPQEYLVSNWPIRYASISPDGLLIAVAGRHGLVHYSTSSGRWKQFTNQFEQDGFTVKGGLQWYQHVLIAACQATITGESQLRLYSRDEELANNKLLYIETLPASVILTSLFEDSLLVYTRDNTFYHYLIVINNQSISLQLCGSITFEGVVGEPERVRGMSWMIPQSQQRFGDPMDDLTVATIIFLVDGKLVLLRPRRAGNDAEEVAYDMQILHDRIEYYWTHLQGIGTLENSLWGYDGSSVKLWLDALTIEESTPKSTHGRKDYQDSGDEDEDDEDEDETPEYKTIEESLSIPLDFYPICVVLEKGIIIGVEPEISIRKNLEFAVFRSGTTTQLFLHQLLRYYLLHHRMREAVVCAASYQSLIYFAHVLEILLHAVLEDEADALAAEEDASFASLGSVSADASDQSNASIVAMDRDTSSSSIASSLASQSSSTSLRPRDREPIFKHRSKQSVLFRPLLPVIVDFLDHFDESLSVVVACARKTEIVRWSYLFSVVGNPRDLFEKCLEAGDLKTAGSYLLVLQNQEPLEESTQHTAQLLSLAAKAENWALAADLLRYMRSIDETGAVLKDVLELTGLLDDTNGDGLKNGHEGSGNGLLSVNSAAPPRFHRSVSSISLLDTPKEEDEEDLSSSDVEKRLPSADVSLDDDASLPDGESLGQLRSKMETPSFEVHPSNGHALIEDPPMASTPPSKPIGLPHLSLNGKELSTTSSPSTPPPLSSAQQVPNLATLTSGTVPLSSSNFSLHRVGLGKSDKIWGPTSPGGGMIRQPSQGASSSGSAGGGAVGNGGSGVSGGADNVGDDSGEI